MQGIQSLYGKKTKGDPQLKPNVPSGNDICVDPKIDTAFSSHDGATYAFKGNNYYKLTENAIADGYPKLISQGWPGLAG